jgi:hypothetical protein
MKLSSGVMKLWIAFQSLSTSVMGLSSRDQSVSIARRGLTTRDQSFMTPDQSLVELPASGPCSGLHPKRGADSH